MVVIGLVLIALALILGFLAFYGLPTADTQLGWDFLGTTYQISPVAIFFIGAGTMLGLLLGLWLLSAGLKRSARKSRELRELKKQQKATVKADAERARVERERPVVTERQVVTERPATGHADGATRADDTRSLPTDRDSFGR